MKIIMACLLLVFAAAWPGDAARAEEPEWSAGIAAVKITPAKPIPLSGYAARTKPFERVDQDIYAKALALKDAQGRRAVLLTVDLCTLPRDVGDGARSRIVEKTGLDPASVLLNISHSHSAPQVALQGDAGIVEYTREFQNRVVEAAEQALAKMQPAKLSYGSGIAHFAVNRREFTARGVILGVNSRGLSDRGVPVLRVDGADGKLLAALFGYACHNTTNPSSHLGVGGDYAGFAKAYVQEHFPGVEALFVQGCGGDSNPYPRHQLADAARHGEELGKEVCRLLETPKAMQPVRGPLACAAVAAELPLLTPDREALEAMTKKGSSLDKQTAQKMLAVLDKGEKLPAVYRAPVSAWQLGDLTLVALPDEVVVDYVTRLGETLGPLRLWVAGYCQEVAGYIPSKRVLQEGGYETRGLYFETGLFAPGVEDALVKAATEAAEKAGRIIPKSQAPNSKQ